jgi:glucose/arabinose dehydrogenase
MKQSKCLILILLLSGLLNVVSGQVSNPIPERITKTGLSVELKEFVQMPHSSSTAPRARINLLKHSEDGSGRLFVNDLRGKLYVIVNKNVSTYLDLAAQFSNFKGSPGLGTGFGAFAFHPDFASNGKLYTTHSEHAWSGTADFEGSLSTVALQWVITEWTTSAPGANSFAGTKRELLRVNMPSSQHGIQDIAFNPNSKTGDSDYGMLYICVGYGFQFSPDAQPIAHTRQSILGTIIRIDPLGNNSANGKYGIPADNPFASDEDSTTLGEIWAIGFRNPHRICWDTGGSNKMFVGDIGEANIEEVNLVEAGADYGWHHREGTFLYNPTGNSRELFPLPSDDHLYGYKYPVAQYDHDEGRSVVGGFVYRGKNVPQLYGKYLFGDIVRGRIFYVDEENLVQGSQAKINELTLIKDGSEVTLLGLVNDSRVDLRFGMDANGEIYILNKRDGMIRMLVGSSNQSQNLLTNPGFEADGSITFNPTGWNTWSSFGYTDVTGTWTPTAHEGTFFAYHWRDTPYDAWTSQRLTNLSNGLYTLKAWVRSSGGQQEAQMGAVIDGGNRWLYVNIPPTWDWTEITIKDIPVTDGTAEVGFWSVAGPNQEIDFDAIEFLKQ